jgi:hypothetical protein
VQPGWLVGHCPVDIVHTQCNFDCGGYPWDNSAMLLQMLVVKQPRQKQEDTVQRSSSMDDSTLLCVARRRNRLHNELNPGHVGFYVVASKVCALVFVFWMGQYSLGASIKTTAIVSGTLFSTAL